jgi:riboflavin-specific deaminase-like protein
MDEEIAWALVRAAVALTHASDAAAPTTVPGPRRIQLPAGPVAWVEVDESGGWRTSAPPNDAARHLLDLYLPLAFARDLVIGQLGQSLDGRIATSSGDSHYITGPEDIRRLHRLRALVDAVVVGAGTVALDNPRLTVREVEGENPVRVVLDPDGRLAVDLRVFSDSAARTLVIRRADEEVRPLWPPAPRVEQRGEVLSLPADFEGFAPVDVLDALRARGLRRVLIEGGGLTVSRFLQAGLLDRLHVTVAPMLIGSGRPAITLPPVDNLSGALRLKCRHVHLGEDLLFDLDLR